MTVSFLRTPRIVRKVEVYKYKSISSRELILPDEIKQEVGGLDKKKFKGDTLNVCFQSLNVETNPTDSTNLISVNSINNIDFTEEVKMSLFKSSTF